MARLLLLVVALVALLDGRALVVARRGAAVIMAVIERIRDELKLPIFYVSQDCAEVDRLATAAVAFDA